MINSWHREGDALLQDLKHTKTGDRETALWRIGQCGIFLRYLDTVILIDPVLTPIVDTMGMKRTHFDPPFAPESDFPVDAVFCTHNHLDHLNPETIQRIALSHPAAKFYIPAGVMEEAKDLFHGFSSRVIGLRQDETISLSDAISVTAIAEAHDHYQTDEQGNEKALGYLFRLGGIRLFHAGDTLATKRLTEDLNARGPIDLALLPINGRDWIREADNIIGNMNHQEAALFADQIHCGTVIPLHYDMMIGNEENPLHFAMYMEEHYPRRAYHLLKLGEPYLYHKS